MIRFDVKCKFFYLLLVLPASSEITAGFYWRLVCGGVFECSVGLVSVFSVACFGVFGLFDV